MRIIPKSGDDSIIIDDIISRFGDLSKEDKIGTIFYLIKELKRLHNISEQEIIGKKEIMIPIGVFGNELSSLEAIVKYLKENERLKFSKIAKLLNRSNKTIWSTYHNALKKMPSPFGIVSKEILIPASAIADRSFSTLESVVGFIKDIGYSNHEIAVMLRLDDSTIWATYDKVKKKRGIKVGRP
ncbi:hypothetical protein HYS31_02375 [Candidatus Woesearchaeota archaeon]|nr:hypothetical protein [Candidatus Woesearchaeota archaeon]